MSSPSREAPKTAMIQFVAQAFSLLVDMQAESLRHKLTHCAKKTGFPGIR
jgi:hypothetical protein